MDVFFYFMRSLPRWKKFRQQQGGFSSLLNKMFMQCSLGYVKMKKMLGKEYEYEE